MSGAAVECKPCARSFQKIEHYFNHLIDSPRHHYCKPCNRVFVNEAAKKDHLESSSKHRHSPKDHKICPWCEKKVTDLDAHNKQYHIKCSPCGRWFEDQSDIEEHSNEEHKDIYCVDCSRLFKYPNELKIHMMSSKHATKDVKCRGADCKAKFLTMGCLIAHWETGACTSGMDIEELENDFSELDREGLFVEKKLLQPVFDCEILDGQKKYQCPLCPKAFRYPQQLDQHIRSPKHKNRGAKPFICPSKKCSMARFSSLSGLLLHRERGNCERAHNHKLNALCDQLATEIKDLELKREIEAVRKNLESLMSRFSAKKDD